MNEPVTRDLVDRTELRRILVEAGDPSHTPKWRSALRHAIGRLDAMPSVECPRGWTRDEVLHELDTHPGAVCEYEGFDAQWRGIGRYWVESWHPEVRRYDVRVVLPPVTVWVPLTKLVGRTLPGETEPVYNWSFDLAGRWEWTPDRGSGWRYFPDGVLDIESGRVEVLAEGDA